MKLCIELEKNWTTKNWYSTWRDNLLADPSRTVLKSPDHAFAPSLSLHFNHFYVLIKDLPPSILISNLLLSLYLTSSCLKFFRSTLLDNDIQGHVWSSEMISCCWKSTLLATQPLWHVPFTPATKFVQHWAIFSYQDPRHLLTSLCLHMLFPLP